MAHMFDCVIRLNDQFSGAFKNVNKSLTQFQKQQKYIASDMQKVGRNTEKIGKTLMTHVTVPLIGIGAAALKTSNDFQDGMAQVSTIADTTKASMGNLSKGVIDLSNKTGKGVNELAKAEYEALSASADTAKVTEFLGVATKASVGGFTDVSTAVNGLTNVLNSYGLEADKANDIANQLLITQNLGKTTFGELATTMGKATPVAANLGLKTQELFSSLAVTTAQGLSTSESVTALKAAMSNIVKPSDEAKKAAQALGIEFEASKVKTKGWLPFLTDLSSKLKQASPELAKICNEIGTKTKQLNNLTSKGGKGNKKQITSLKKELKGLEKEMKLLAEMSDSPISAMSKMFGSVDGLNSILMLTSEQGIGKYNEAMKQMGTNTHALDDAYNKMQTPAEKFRQSLNRAKNSLLGVGGALTPTMETLGKVIDKITSRISKLTPRQQETIVKFGLIAASIAPALIVAGKFTSSLGKTIKSISKLTKSIKKAGGILSWFMSPGHIAIAVIAAIAIAAILLIKNWDKISKVIKKVGKAISKFTGISGKDLKKFFKFVGSALGKGLKEVGKALKSLKSKVLPPLKSLIKTIGRIVKSLMPILRPILKFVSIVFVTGFCIAFNIICTVISAVVSTIGGIIGGLLKVFEGVINFLVGVFTGNWTQAWESVKQTFSGVVDILHSLWNGIIDLLSAPVNAVVNLLDSAFHDAISKVKEAWNGVKEFLKHPITGTISLIKHGNLSGVKKDGSHAIGLNRVPFNGYMAELHEGERVLTKQETQQLDNKKSNGININIENMTVRKESDIKAIATEIVKQISIQNSNMPQGAY